MTAVTLEHDISRLLAGLVEVQDARLAPSCEALRAECAQVVSAVTADGMEGGDQRRTAIRQLLRAGGFKPSGRNKPAQEYLLRTVTEDGQLPAICNAVDLINMTSLRAGLPISLVSLERIGTDISLRYGRSGESFVFNASGQELRLDGLVCLCSSSADRSQPAGTPVKDSMRAKVTTDDHHLLACIYASDACLTHEQMIRLSGELATGFERFCGASSTNVRLIPS